MITGLGEKLKAMRVNRSLSQADVAKAIHSTASLISAYEKGERLPSLLKLMELAGFFHTSTDYLLGIEHTEKINLDGLSPEDAKAIQTLIKSLKSK